MSGVDAARQLLVLAAHEEVIAADLVARALGQSKRRLMRDWRRRKNPETRIGKHIMLASTLVVETYFPHRLPAT